MSNVYFFGDSYTYGYGLPDCVIFNQDENDYNPGPTHSNLGWTTIVAANLGLTHVNLSKCGTSNMRIHYDIRTQTFEPDDIVITQWSFSPRCVILDDSLQDVNTWIDTDVSRNFFMAHGDTDLERRSLMIVEHTELLMQLKAVRYIAFANKPFEPVMHIHSKIVDYQDRFTTGTDPHTGHPDLASNQLWAAQITEILKQKFGI